MIKTLSQLKGVYHGIKVKIETTHHSIHPLENIFIKSSPNPHHMHIQFHDFQVNQKPK